MNELEQRKREFTDAIDQKLSIDEIRSEFTALKKLDGIYEKVDLLARNSVAGDKFNKALEDIRLELIAMVAAQEKQSKGLIGGLVGGSNSATDRMIQARDKAVQEAEAAKENEAVAKQQVELLKQKLSDLDKKYNQLNGYVESLTRNQSTEQTYIQSPIVSSQVSTKPVSDVALVQTTEGENPVSTKPMKTDGKIVQVDEDPDAPDATEVEEPIKKQGFWSRLFHKKLL